MNNLIKTKRDNQPTTFGRVIDDIFQNNLSSFSNDDFWGANSINKMLQVPVNIQETDSSYIVELVAPGAEKKDFQITLEGDILTVSFRKTEKSNEENKRWIMQQYRHGEFLKTFTLDKTVNTEKIEANYEKGILKISIPKSEQVKKTSQTIDIQ